MTRYGVYSSYYFLFNIKSYEDTDRINRKQILEAYNVALMY